MQTASDPTLVSMWLHSPGMREPIRLARTLGHDLESSFAEIRAQVSDEELAGWLRDAMRPRR